jgi:hypothetical protein
MEPEGSLPRSQELSTCTYPEPDQSSPQHPTLPRPAREADYLAPVSTLSTQCGHLDVSQPYKPPRPVTVIALLPHFIADYHELGLRIWICDSGLLYWELSPVPASAKGSADGLCRIMPFYNYRDLELR